MKKTYLEQLDVFRALAALSVCAVHFSYNSIFHIYFKQALFVQFFFTLSGFVIYLNYHNYNFNFYTIQKFLIKRFFRLYPLHLFFLLIFFLIEFIKYFLQSNYGVIANNKPFVLNGINNLFLHLFFLQHYADKYAFNGPAWSISVEMFLYITFSILIFLNKKLFLFIPIFYIIFFLLFLTNTYGAGYSNQAFFSGLYSFFIGCIFCFIYLKDKNFFKSKFYNFTYYVMILLFLAEMFGYKLLFKLNYSFLYSIFFGLLIYFSCFLNKDFLIYKILFNNFFIFLGKISYSIYLSHVFIFFMFNNFLRFVLKRQDVVNLDGKVSLELNVFEANLFTLFVYILTIFFSSLTYKYIENKFYKKK